MNVWFCLRQGPLLRSNPADDDLDRKLGDQKKPHAASMGDLRLPLDRDLS